MPKRWWQSKTIWFNVAIAVGVAVDANLGLMRDQLSPGVYVALASGIAGVNVLLRMVTNQAIGGKDAKL